MGCEHPLSVFICTTNASAGTIFADLGGTAVSSFSIFAGSCMSQFMSSGADKAVIYHIVGEIPRLERILLSFVSGIGQNWDPAVLNYFFGNPRGLVAGIHRYKFDFWKSVCDLVIYCVPCHAVTYIS